jgi:hypothetical protein
VVVLLAVPLAARADPDQASTRSPPPRLHAYLAAGHSQPLTGSDSGPLHLGHEVVDLVCSARQRQLRGGGQHRLRSVGAGARDGRGDVGRRLHRPGGAAPSTVMATTR